MEEKNFFLKLKNFSWKILKSVNLVAASWCSGLRCHYHSVTKKYQQFETCAGKLVICYDNSLRRAICTDVVVPPASNARKRKASGSFSGVKRFQSASSLTSASDHP